MLKNTTFYEKINGAYALDGLLAVWSTTDSPLGLPVPFRFRHQSDRETPPSLNSLAVLRSGQLIQKGTLCWIYV